MKRFLDIDAFLEQPIDTLIIGQDHYAAALSAVLGAPVLSQEQVLSGPVQSDDGGFIQILRDLERVIVVVETSQAASDILRSHEALWRWIEKLSPEGDQHEVSFLFVLPDSSAALEAAIALGLGLELIDPGTSGHGVVHMSDSLETILDTLARIRPMDLPPLRARQRADVRHLALRALREAYSAVELRSAAHQVLDIFAGCEYQLDLFCREPSHRNGNLLRSHLRSLVTEGVTPETCRNAQSVIANCLTALTP